eukprot:TRINITY_DN23883_c0_g1_i2.p1 TRINITY_DN23883_c0_g1~~TRINITY_DN23883_c0_g1_i2.p1  ORF type:complete len:246 (+),score=43.68 TRINITY_DN23883_c0_g1_i2:180-917(+)
MLANQPVSWFKPASSEISQTYSSSPPGVSSGGSAPAMDDAAKLTSTLMIKNLPSRCQQEEVLRIINESGFEDLYDFFYMPARTSPQRAQNYGYAFVNFTSPEDAHRFVGLVCGGPLQLREKRLHAVPARIQGLAYLESHFQGKGVCRARAAPFFRDGLEEEGAESSTKSSLSTAENLRHFLMSKDATSKASGLEPLLPREHVPSVVRVRSTSATSTPTWSTLPLPMKVDISASFFQMPMKLDMPL